MAHTAKPGRGTANVIGAGVNGLTAAITLANAGMGVNVYETQAQAGGAARTLPLTLPGFAHDFGAAVLPMAAGSPFLTRLPLEKHGLRWIYPDAPLAHPLDGGDAVVLERDLDRACAGLGADGARWRSFVGPFAERWPELAEDILQPPLHIPRSPLLLARFGMRALQPATWIARRFRSSRTRALWAGMAAHSVLPLDAWASSAAGLALAVTAHSNGWPLAEGGTQSLTDALVEHLQALGGAVHLNSTVRALTELPPAEITLCDVSPRQLLQLCGDEYSLSRGYKSRLRRFRSAPGTFKLDYALAEPIPWAAQECARALTIHLGGTFEEIAGAEATVSSGRAAERPYVLLAQPTRFDSSRAPAGRHIAWAYCHVPYGYDGDATEAIESQIERFAPGFRDCVLARSTLTPASLAANDANLHGGDISGGAMDLRQIFFRPTAGAYATSDPAVWLCSASTPPGGGVHGMCGHNAARAALTRLRG